VECFGIYVMGEDIGITEIQGKSLILEIPPIFSSKKACVQHPNPGQNSREK
jgi:hypothetical protein